MSQRALSSRRIVTCDPARSGKDNPLGVIEHGAVVYEGNAIRWVGPIDELPTGVPVTDHGDRVITPGLVDAHTHAAWMGSRHTEYAMRMAGATYEEISAAGGGILSTHRAIAEATESEITEALAARLRRMAALGVTTCEVKSGYGLEPEGEKKQLLAIAEAAKRPELPYVVPTFLALHALPESAKQSRDAFVLRAATQLVPEIAKLSLAKFVDAYIDRNAFTVEEARLVCEAAKTAGLGVRLHVGQFADVGGAELACELGADSVDHLEHVSTEAIANLAMAKVHAVLLPIASFTLGQAPPPVGKLRVAGVTIVVASDANPGTAPSESLPLALALAVRTHGLGPDTAILAATRNAAASLRLFGERAAPEMTRGVIAENARADIVVWNLPHEHAIVQPWASPMTHVVYRDGVIIAGDGEVN